MVTRRNFIGASALGFAMNPLIGTAKPPIKRFVAQAAHLTVDIPTHWSHTPPLPFGMTTIGGDDGFFVASVMTELDLTDERTRGILGLDTRVEPTGMKWRDMDAVRFDLPKRRSSFATSFLVIPNPNPILTYSGLADRIVLIADTVHFEAILESVKFGLATLSSTDLAKSILDIIETHAWVRAEIDWSPLYSRAEEMTSHNEVDSLLRNYVLPALKSAGDNHSFMRDLDGLVNIATPTMNGQEPNLPTGEIVEGFGYLHFPGHNSFDPDYAHAYSSIAALLRDEMADNGVNGWIIDLREMSGGSVSPVLTPLYPFLPDGRIAGFVDAYGNTMWIEKHGTTITPSAYQVNDVPWREGLDSPDIPVAVLTGGFNGSAGEFVQIALMARTNLQTFGGQTAGLTIGNATFNLFNDSTFALATSAEIDAEGTIYESSIHPDALDSLGLQTGTSSDSLQPVFDWLANG